MQYLRLKVGENFLKLKRKGRKMDELGKAFLLGVFCGAFISVPIVLILVGHFN